MAQILLDPRAAAGQHGACVTGGPNAIARLGNVVLMVDEVCKGSEAAAVVPRRHRRFIPSARSNLPVWPAVPPAVDRSGTGFVLLGLGPGASGLIAQWRADAMALGHTVRDCHQEEIIDIGPALAWLDDVLSSARVGWRLMLAGPASLVLVLSAEARASGMIEDEIRVFALDHGQVRVHCIHCSTAFSAVGGPGSEVTCPACLRRLFVHQHLSRRHAALVSFTTEFERAP